MLDSANSINHQKIPQSSTPSIWCVNTEQRAERRQKHSSEKTFTDGKWCLERKRSQAFESPLSARSDSLWWLWNIQVKRFVWNPSIGVIEAQTAVQSQLAAEASYETNARHLLQINRLDRVSALFLLLDSILMSFTFIELPDNESANISGPETGVFLCERRFDACLWHQVE